MISENSIPQVAVIGPGTSWEAPEAIDVFIKKLKKEGIGTMVLDEQRDPRLLALTAVNVRNDHIGGLAVVNYSYSSDEDDEGYDEELDLSADPKVGKAAQLAANLALPIFINQEPTMGGLDLEVPEGRKLDLIIIENGIEAIKTRLLEVTAGAA